VRPNVRAGDCMGQKLERFIVITSKIAVIAARFTAASCVAIGKQVVVATDSSIAMSMKCATTEII